MYSVHTFLRKFRDFTKKQLNNKVTADSRLHPQCTTYNKYLPVFIVKQTLTRIDAVVLAVVLCFPRLEIQSKCHRAHDLKTCRHTQNCNYITYNFCHQKRIMPQITHQMCEARECGF